MTFVGGAPLTFVVWQQIPLLLRWRINSYSEKRPEAAISSCAGFAHAEALLPRRLRQTGTSTNERFREDCRYLFPRSFARHTIPPVTALAADLAFAQQRINTPILTSDPNFRDLAGPRRELVAEPDTPIPPASVA